MLLHIMATNMPILQYAQCASAAAYSIQMFVTREDRGICRFIICSQHLHEHNSENGASHLSHFLSKGKVGQSEHFLFKKPLADDLKNSRYINITS